MPKLFILPTQQNGLAHFLNAPSGSVMTGGPEVDVFNSSQAGPSQMSGGAGDDYYYVTGPGQAVVEQPGEGLDTVFLGFKTFTGTSYTLPDNVENLIFPNQTHLTITGNAANNDISGQWGSLSTQNTIDGGAGDDIITVGTDHDVLTGGSGSDIFRFTVVPWGSATITDFHVGEDILDLRQMFAGRSYSGSDPVADGWLKFQADGAGGTAVLFDPDGPSDAAYGFFQIADLQGVSPGALTAQQDWYFKTPADAPTVSSFQADVTEANLPDGSKPSAAFLSKAGYITVTAPNGLADLWVGGHQVMSGGAFTPADYTLPEGDVLHVQSYDASQHLLTLGFTLNNNSAVGGDPIETFEILARDSTGAMASGDFTVLIHDDNPAPQADSENVAAGATVTGDVLTNDAPGADGGIHVVNIASGGASTTTTLGPNGASIGGQYGTLTIHADGTYSYTANADAPPSDVAQGRYEDFVYRVQDSDGSATPGAQLRFLIDGTASPPPPPPPPPPPASPPPPPSDGATLQAHDGGSTLVGGAGADTLIGAHGPDQMTGAGGADHFVFNEVPWQAAQITDFTSGVDKIDLSALLSQAGYSGSDPVGAGFVKFLDDGHGDTWLYFDPTPSSDPWGDYVATIQGVAPASLSDADLVLGSSPPSPPPPPASPPPPPPVSPPPAGGQTLQAHDGGATLVGGSGDDTLIGAHGPDQMTGAGGADHFVFNEVPWQGAQITDFAPGTDKIDLSALLQQAGYTGSNPVADGYVKFLDDGHGDTWLYYDPTPSSDPWGDYVATLQDVTPSSLGVGDIIWR